MSAGSVLCVAAAEFGLGTPLAGAAQLASGYFHGLQHDGYKSRVGDQQGLPVGLNPG
jgi:hypothetical protein